MGTLEDLVCGGYDDFAMTDESHLPILHQITAGLNQLHSFGIVHGNLKPSNILVSFPKGDTNEPTMKLADFGIRHAVRDEANRLTQFQLITTEGWMCPTDTQDPISPSFDVFSLGCVCGFIFLNGLHPFGSDPISGIINRQPIRLNLGQEKCGVLTPALLNLIARMLSFDSAKRPSTASILPFFSKQQSIAVTSELLKKRPIPDLMPIVLSSFISYTGTSHQPFIRQSVSPLQQPSVSPSTNECNIYTRQTSSSLYDESSKPIENEVGGYRRDLKWRSHHTFISSYNGTISFQCSECPKTFSRKISLSHHLRRHFPPKIKCDFCPKMFFFNWDKDQHMNIHTGARPYECKQCPRTFTTNSGLIQHRIYNHLRPQFDCPFCHKKFSRLITCKKHWRGDKKGKIACTVRRQQLPAQ